MKKRNFSVFLLALIIMIVFALLNGCATTISKGQIDTFRSAKTARIVVNQSLPKGVNLHFEDIPKRFLGYAGLRVVTDTEDYDLLLKIEAKGRALGANYISGGWLYTGASLSGSISLETRGVRAYRKFFRGIIPTPTSITIPTPTNIPMKIGKSPADAPFWEVRDKPGSFLSKIAEMIGEVYGADAVIHSLKDEQSVRWGNLGGDG